MKFVQLVIDGDFIIFKRKKASIEEEMSRKFSKIDGSFEYLLNIKTWQYSEEAVKQLNQDAISIQSELETLTKTSTLDMWKTDILK